jgi:hypothetical protein
MSAYDILREFAKHHDVEFSESVGPKIYFCSYIVCNYCEIFDTCDFRIAGVEKPCINKKYKEKFIRENPEYFI